MMRHDLLRAPSNTSCCKITPKTAEPVDTADVSRLMDETDQQMAKPSNRRRNALAHLRAAVAATIADKSLGKDGGDSRETYRNDLAKAVRATPRTIGCAQICTAAIGR